MGCFCGVYLSWLVNRAIQNHGHRVDLSIDPPCYDVVDLSLDVKMDVSRGLRMSDLLVDRNLDATMDVSHDLRKNDRLDDRKMVATKDVNHRDVLVGRCNYALGDLMTDASSDGNLYRRTNDLLDDLNLDDVRHGLTMGDDLMTDVNLCHRMNDLLDDRNLDATMDVNLCHRRNDLLDDHHGQKMDGNLDVMNHHVK
jgi:hypothetical protein